MAYYKLTIETLAGFKKELEASNNLLNQLQTRLDKQEPQIIKQIDKNNKQIMIIKDEYFID